MSPLMTAWWTYIPAVFFILLLWAALSIGFVWLFHWFAARNRLVARKSPIVDQVDIGLGPEVWRFGLGGTVYLCRLIPLALTIKGSRLALGGIAASLSLIPLSLLFAWLAVASGSVANIPKTTQGPTTSGVYIENGGTAAGKATLSPLLLFGKGLSAMWRPIDEKPDEWRYRDGNVERSGFFGAVPFVSVLLSAGALLLSWANVVGALFQFRGGAFVLIVASSLVPGFSVASRLVQAAVYFFVGLLAFGKGRDGVPFWVAFLALFVAYQFYGVIFSKYYVGLLGGLVDQFSWVVSW